MKYRCPHCGKIFTQKVSVCPHCGKILKYGPPQGQQNGSNPPRTETPNVRFNKPKNSPKAFNTMHFFTILLGVILLACIFFVPLYYYTEGSGETLVKTEFSIFTLTKDFFMNVSTEMAGFNVDDFWGSSNYVVNKLLGLLVFPLWLIFFIVNLVLWFRSFGYLGQEKAPKEAQGEGGVGRAGQWKPCMILLILVYLQAFVPFICAKIYLSTRMNFPFFNPFFQSVIAHSPFHGLTYYNILIIVLFIVVIVFSALRMGAKRNYNEVH